MQQAGAAGGDRSVSAPPAPRPRAAGRGDDAGRLTIEGRHPAERPAAASLMTRNVNRPEDALPVEMNPDEVELSLRSASSAKLTKQLRESTCRSLSKATFSRFRPAPRRARGETRPPNRALSLPP